VDDEGQAVRDVLSQSGADPVRRAAACEDGVVKSFPLRDADDIQQGRAERSSGSLGCQAMFETPRSGPMTAGPAACNRWGKEDRVPARVRPGKAEGKCGHNKKEDQV
jgi:hypothetical protein